MEDRPEPRQAGPCEDRGRVFRGKVTAMSGVGEEYLKPTSILDSDHPAVRTFAREAAGGESDPVGRAVNLYYAVRDGILYDPYSPFYLPEHYRASEILKRGRGYCVCKAGLLCALGRACGIPSRVGFATVRSHIATRQLLDFLGSDLFVYHGFTEFLLEGKWVKATPAFNLELCRRHQVEPLEFDGRHDSLFQPYNTARQKFMEYVAYHGTHADIPLALILQAWEETYGRERVREWIRAFETSGAASARDFYKEEP
jgi:transglutaminase-like putative cysteine protease